MAAGDPTIVTPTTPSEQSLNISFAAPAVLPVKDEGLLPGVRTLLMGDSITQRAGEGNGKIWTLSGSQEFSTNTVSGPFTQFNAACGHPFNVVRNGGVAGQKSDQIAARFDAEWNTAVVNAGGVDVVNIMAGTNDLQVTGYDWTVTFKNVKEMVDKTLNRGAFAIVWAIPPKNGLNTTGVTHLARYNQAIKEYCRSLPNTIFVDTPQQTSDNSVVTGAWKSGYASDGTHPDTYISNYLMGKNAHTQIRNYFRPFQLISSAVDSFDGLGSPAGNVSLGNGCNILTAVRSLATAGGGTATANGSSVISGTPGSGWTLSTSGAGLTTTCSQPARSDGVGNDQQFSFAIASGTGQSAELFWQSSTPYLAGKFYELSAEVQIVSGETFLEKTYGGIRAATGSLNYVRDMDYANIVANAAQPESPLTFRLVTPRIPYISGEQMRVFFSFDFTDVVGTAVVKVGRVAVREYSTQV